MKRGIVTQPAAITGTLVQVLALVQPPFRNILCLPNPVKSRLARTEPILLLGFVSASIFCIG